MGSEEEYLKNCCGHKDKKIDELKFAACDWEKQFDLIMSQLESEKAKNAELVGNLHPDAIQGLIMAGGARKLLDELGARNVQIAELEKRNQDESLEKLTLLQTLDEKDAEIEELEKRIEGMVKHCETYHRELEERNVELNLRIGKIVRRCASYQNGLEQKLKTAEDALKTMTHSRDFWKECN